MSETRANNIRDVMIELHDKVKAGNVDDLETYLHALRNVIYAMPPDLTVQDSCSRSMNELCEMLVEKDENHEVKEEETTEIPDAERKLLKLTSLLCGYCTAIEDSAEDVHSELVSILKQAEVVK